jgi:hypothetical protein
MAAKRRKKTKRIALVERLCKNQPTLMLTRFALVYCLALLTLAAQAQSPVTVTVDTQSRGYEIPADFAGVSIFNGTQVHNHRGIPGNLFSGTNSQLITIFKNTGLHHLRLGATGSSRSGSTNLCHKDIDALFAFAKETDIKVIYSLHAADGVATAEYIWKNYRPYLDCFAFDNEPDKRVEEDAKKLKADGLDYFTDWDTFARSVVKALPEAKFAGPDAAGRSLVKTFMKHEGDSGMLSLITQHIYVGGNPVKKKVDTAHAIEAMLSRKWVTENYPGLYDGVLVHVVKKGFPFRLTESDDHVHGRENASDTFTAALWALDYSHWWAAHGAAGVNFQNTEWLTTDTFHVDAATNYQIYPRAYGIKAFDIGGHGHVESVVIGNTNDLNLAAYAVGDETNVFVTVINKEYGPGARDASVSILLKGSSSANAATMVLTAPNGNVQATNGITLGGGVITNDAPWHGEWTALKPSAEGQYKVKVSSASAAVIKIQTR